MAKVDDCSVGAVGPGLLAESNRQHLENAAAQRTAKIGVRLDAIDAMTASAFSAGTLNKTSCPLRTVPRLRTSMLVSMGRRGTPR